MAAAPMVRARRIVMRWSRPPRRNAGACSLTVENLPDLGEQLVAGERLGEEVARELEVVAAGVTGDAEQLERAAARTQLPGELRAAHERHAHVGQQQVDAVAVLVEHL